MSRVICACRPGVPLPGCPKCDPPPPNLPERPRIGIGPVTTAGILVAEAPTNLPSFMDHVGTERGVFDFCRPCGLGILTAWPASLNTREARAKWFADIHVKFCPEGTR